MMERSRTPRHGQLERCRDGVAVSVHTLDLGAQLLQPLSLLLVADAEMQLLVDDDEAGSLKAIVLPSRAWVPTTMSTVPSARPFLAAARSAEPTMREAWATVTAGP